MSFAENGAKPTEMSSNKKIARLHWMARGRFFWFQSHSDPCIRFLSIEFVIVRRRKSNKRPIRTHHFHSSEKVVFSLTLLLSPGYAISKEIYSLSIPSKTRLTSGSETKLFVSDFFSLYCYYILMFQKLSPSCKNIHCDDFHRRARFQCLFDGIVAVLVIKHNSNLQH